MITRATLDNYGLIIACDQDATVTNNYRGASNHYCIARNQTRGHDISDGTYGPTTKKVTITDGADTVYLPFWQNKISSVEIPAAGPSVFITDNMSGCCLFLGKKADDTLVAFHANSELHSSKADMEGKAANYQHTDTTKELDRLVQLAKADVGVVSVVGGCSKGTYNKGITTGGAWLGGTTIVGFRDATGWKFFYQTWGSLGGGGVMVHDVKQFYP